MFKIITLLYGKMDTKSVSGKIVIFFKSIYILFTLPYLLIILLDSLKHEIETEFGIIKRIFVHISAIALSFVIWLFLLLWIFKHL